MVGWSMTHATNQNCQTYNRRRSNGGVVFRVRMSTPGQGDLIDLTVRHQDGTKVLFRIKRSTQLKKLMSAYCDLQSLDIPDFAFFWVDDRTRVRRLVEHMTPNELEMEDGDEIDALLRQPRRAR